jgi:hypothetical protein
MTTMAEKEAIIRDIAKSMDKYKLTNIETEYVFEKALELRKKWNGTGVRK